jgi:hypothetical protein
MCWCWGETQHTTHAAIADHALQPVASRPRSLSVVLSFPFAQRRVIALAFMIRCAINYIHTYAPV